MARQLVCPGTKSPHDRSERTQNAKKQLLDRRALSQTVSGAAACSHALSGSLLESSRSAARLARAAAHQCMYGCVRAAQKAPKTRASCVVVQKAARLSRWLEYRARTAEPSAWPRALRSHPHRKHQTCEEGARARRERARAGRRGAGPRRWSLAAPT
mgnify:CR=1 FL=1